MDITCILCRIDKDESKFSIEHIIPESLGSSKLTLDVVCKECNDKLGNKIDSELVKLEFFSYPRIILDLKGKTGKLPKMFKGARLKDGRPVKVNYNKITNKLELQSPTTIKSKKIGDEFRYEIRSSPAIFALGLGVLAYLTNMSISMNGLSGYGFDSIGMMSFEFNVLSTALGSFAIGSLSTLAGYFLTKSEGIKVRTNE